MFGSDRGRGHKTAVGFEIERGVQGCSGGNIYAVIHGIHSRSEYCQNAVGKAESLAAFGILKDDVPVISAVKEGACLPGAEKHGGAFFLPAGTAGAGYVFVHRISSLSHI